MGTEKGIYVGSYVQILTLPEADYGGAAEEIRKSSIGRICRISEPPEETSDDGIKTRHGEYLVSYIHISEMGLQSLTFYVKYKNISVVEASEDLLLLYSPDIWQLINPFGELQNTNTFRRLVLYFGYS